VNWQWIQVWASNSLAVGFDADLIVNRVLKTLLTAEVFLGSLHGDVAQQELDLVQFPSGIAAQPGAGPAEIMRGQVLNACSLGAVRYDMAKPPVPPRPFPRSCLRGKRTETRGLRSGRRTRAKNQWHV